MRLRRTLALLLFVLVLISTSFAQSRGKIGTVTFAIPSGWNLSNTGQKAILTAPGLTGSQKCFITINNDMTAPSDFRVWSDKQWETFRAGRTIERGGEAEYHKGEGVELGVRAVAFKTQPETYALFITVSADGRALYAAMEANDYELLQKHESVLTTLIDSFDREKGGSSGGLTVSGGSPAIGEPIAVPDMPERLPAMLPMGQNWDAEAARLAKLVAEGGPQSLAALHTAARACGFGIRTNDRQELSKSLAEPNGVFVTEADLTYAWAMEKMGWGLPWSGFADMNKVLAQTLGTTQALELALVADLGMARKSKLKTQKFFADFITALGKEQGAAEFGTFTGDPRITPIQFLFVSRVAYGVGFRMAKEQLKPRLSALSTLILPQPIRSPFDPPAQQQTRELEGYEQDSVAWSLTQMNNILVEAFKNSGLGEEGLEKLGKVTGNLGAMASIFKFFASYLCLEAKFEVVGGPPLQRTHLTTTDAERKTIKVTITTNPDRVMRMMKDYRYLASVLGVDTDMPQAGPLADVETAWSLPDQPMAPSKQFVRFVGSDILRIKTDSSGTAQCDIEGVRQRRQIDPKKAAQINRTARITVTPQLKPPSMQQDLVDATTGALGIFGALGGVSFTKLPSQWSVDGLTKGDALPFVGAFLTPIMETLYRGKWLMPLGYKLQVKDWGYSGFVGTINFTVAGSGQEKVGDRTSSWKFDRQIEVPDVTLLLKTPMPNEATIKQQGDGAYQMRYVDDQTRKYEIKVADRLATSYIGYAECLSDKKSKIENIRTYTFPHARIPALPTNFTLTATMNLNLKTGEYQLMTTPVYLKAALNDKTIVDGKQTRSTDSESSLELFSQLSSNGVSFTKVTGTMPVTPEGIPDGAEIKDSKTVELIYRTPSGKEHKVVANMRWAFVNYSGGFEDMESAMRRAEFLVATLGMTAKLAKPIDVSYPGSWLDDVATCSATEINFKSK